MGEPASGRDVSFTPYFLLARIWSFGTGLFDRFIQRNSLGVKDRDLLLQWYYAASILSSYAWPATNTEKGKQDYVLLVWEEADMIIVCFITILRPSHIDCCSKATMPKGTHQSKYMFSILSLRSTIV